MYPVIIGARCFSGPRILSIGSIMRPGGMILAIAVIRTFAACVLARCVQNRAPVMMKSVGLQCGCTTAGSYLWRIVLRSFKSGLSAGVAY